MDTWATSSLSPQLAARWSIDGDLPARVLPMDLRPQAHEIIRTWLFYTLLRSHAESGDLPWQHVAISGWVLDPDRKKMSKSVGNVVTPMDSLRRHGSDAVRYWAASGRLGVDMTFDPAQLKVGRRLAIKILNASRFVLALAPPGHLPAGTAGASAVSEPLDAALLGRLGRVIGQCTAAFEAYDHAGALAAAEDFFWFFCDDYLELVKDRAYGERGDGPAASARAALRLALSVALRLFAPFLPFVTEEVWSWWQEGSVHRAAWPEPAEALAAGDGAGSPAGTGVLQAASGAIAAIRGAKSGARVSMRTPVRLLVVTARRDHLDALMAVLPDIRAAGRVERSELRFRDQPGPAYRVIL
jgi:valyl-tRNA synthetase